MNTKFKIWSFLLPGWITDNSLENLIQNNPRWATVNSVFYELYHNKHLIVLQSIGKKDINNREIFEGDIVEYTEKQDEHGDSQRLVGYVQYDYDNAAWGIGKDEIWNLFSDFGIYNITVIGNVYENKSIME